MDTGHLTILVTGVLCLLQLVRDERHPWVMPLLLLAGLGSCILACGSGAAWTGRAPSRFTAMVLLRLLGLALTASATVATTAILTPVGGPDRMWLVLSGAVVGVLASLSIGTRVSSPSFVLLLVATAAIAVVAAHLLQPTTDVAAYVDHASSQVAHIRSPYGGSVPNPWGAEDTARFLAPELTDGDRILIGYPYLPASILPAVVTSVLGLDPRYAYLGCLLLASCLLRWAVRGPVADVASVCMLVSPLSLYVVLFYYVEPVILLFVVVAVLAVSSGRRWLRVMALGLLFAGKQYAVVMLPALVVRQRGESWRMTIAPAVVAAGLCLPFLLTDSAGFVHDAVAVQLAQPYRPDSISLVVALWPAGSIPPSWLTGSVPILAGLAVSGWVASRRRLEPVTLIPAIVGLGLLTTVLLSKQAFANYYFLIGMTLVVTAATRSTAVTADAPATPARTDQPAR